MRLFLLSACTLLTPFLLVPGLSAQSGQPTNRVLADLRSDVDRLDQLVRSMRVEMEELARENQRLRQANHVTVSQLNGILRDLESKFERQTESSRRAIIQQVSNEIERLARQTQSAIEALSKSIEGTPQVTQRTTWQDNYPKSGTNYTVKSGDSLGRIARELGSRVDWIRNANRLTSDTIFPGQELFVPLED